MLAVCNENDVRGCTYPAAPVVFSNTLAVRYRYLNDVL